MYENNEQIRKEGCGYRVSALAPFVWLVENSTLRHNREAVFFSQWNL